MKELFAVIVAIAGFLTGMSYHAKWYPESTGEKKVNLSEYIPKPEIK